MYFTAHVTDDGVTAQAVADALTAGLGVTADQVTVTETEPPASMWHRVAMFVAWRHVLTLVYPNDAACARGLEGAADTAAAMAGGVHYTVVLDLFSEHNADIDMPPGYDQKSVNAAVNMLADRVAPALADLAATAWKTA